MKFSVRLKDEAFRKLELLAVFMECDRSGSGTRLMDSYDEVVKILKSHPFAFRKRFGEFRLVAISGVQYQLIYTVHADFVMIHRIVHSKENTGTKYSGIQV